MKCLLLSLSVEKVAPPEGFFYLDKKDRIFKSFDAITGRNSRQMFTSLCANVPKPFGTRLRASTSCSPIVGAHVGLL